MSNQVGEIYPTNCGNLEVVKYINYKKVEVRFLATGYETTCEMGHIKIGQVKDPLHRSVYGVGFIGIGEFKVSVNRKQTKAYRVWNSMLRRCYSEVELDKHPTYIDCTVSPDWHNFQVFAKWHHENHPADGGNYDLDKDIKIEGNKIYGPDACMFVSHKRNIVKAHAKTYTFTSPKGVVTKVYNLRQFCIDNNLNQGTMSQVHSGKRKSHKGWRVA